MYVANFRDRIHQERKDKKRHGCRERMDQLKVERITQSKTVLQNLIGVGCISLKLFGRSVSLKAVFFYCLVMVETKAVQDAEGAGI